MAKSTIDNKELLNLIEKKKMTALQICEKCEISMGTLKRRHHVLVMNERRFIELPGLMEPSNEVELKRGGINLSMKKLAALECPFEIGAKFSIEINPKTKKILLTAA